MALCPACLLKKQPTTFAKFPTKDYLHIRKNKFNPKPKKDEKTLLLRIGRNRIAPSRFGPETRRNVCRRFARRHHRSASINGVSASATTFGFAPEFGYFVADRLRLSGSIAYNLTSSGDTSHALTIGPSVAYYVRLCDRFYYTPEAGIGFAYASAYGANGYGFATGLKFGAFEFRPASHCGISFSLLSLQYTYLSYSSGGYSASGNNVQFDFGVSPTIGFKYYF